MKNIFNIFIKCFRPKKSTDNDERDTPYSSIFNTPKIPNESRVFTGTSSGEKQVLSKRNDTNTYENHLYLDVESVNENHTKNKCSIEIKKCDDNQNLIQSEINESCTDTIPNEIVILSKWQPKSVKKIVVQKVTLNLNNLTVSEFNEIGLLFMRTTQRHYKIIDIKKIINPYTKISFEMKKAEYEILYGKENVKVVKVFHGTLNTNIEQIIQTNFNWRLHGKAKGNIYGKGVSFSPISNYASNYCDKTEEKYMFAVSVLKCFACRGNESMVVPPMFDAEQHLHYDTSEKQNGAVCVKYRDDEFYPEYLITFTGSPKNR